MPVRIDSFRTRPFLLLLGLLLASARVFPFENVLWYGKPATNWESQALPIGNGQLGAMLFGDPQRERIQFNEESLWIGDEKDTGAYQAFGDVLVEFQKWAQPVTGYRRQLHLDQAVHTVTFRQGKATVRQEAFASHPAKIIVVRFSADQPGMLNGSVALTDMHRGRVRSEEHRLISSGSLAGYKYEGAREYGFALNYEAQVAVLHEGGAIRAGEGKIVFTQANSVTLLLAARTDFIQDRAKGWRGKHPHEVVAARIAAAEKLNFEDLLAAHTRDHQALYQRVLLDIGARRNDGPTDARLFEMNKTGVADLGLQELLFNYGRYLLIASSRPGGLPANLQGKWNSSNRPPWRSDYHTDVNVQMNYWLADVANLSECFEPYAAWLNSIREVRKEATREAFKTRGWTMRAENGIFGGSTWEWVESGSAWCLQNVWDHYAFTRDLNYLRNVAYPMMQEVCEFWLDRLKELPDGTLVAPNGYSPEHGPREDGVSHDQQLVWDLFNNTVEASEALRIDAEFRQSLAAKRDRLLGPKIGRWGQLQEWMVDRDDPKDTHRHLSHLVALHPGRQITMQKTPHLAEAVRVSLNARGDISTGWSTAWKINLWARLRDGDRAHKLIVILFRLVGDSRVNYQDGGGLYPNLFDAHPPFQIDGNFGYTAGVCEMLLQSHAGEIELLPALPSAWPNGRVSGLLARGGFEIGLVWRDGKLSSASIRSKTGGLCRLRYGEKTVELMTEKGGRYGFDGGFVELPNLIQ